MQNLNDTSDFNIVEIWLRKDPKRWLAGALAGAFAGLMLMVFSGILCVTLGKMEFLTPFKIAAIPFLGNEAMREGFVLNSLVIGVVVLETLSVLLGVLYAHFTGTNAFAPLFGMGLTWGIFSWIFWNNLMFQSFRNYMVLDISRGAAFFCCLVFGLSLISVSFFDRTLRGR